LNDFIPIFTILKLCKSQKIPVPYDSLSIPAKVMKELVKFVMDKTELSLDMDLYSRLSDDNKSYVSKNFKCSNNSSFVNLSEALEKEETSRIISLDSQELTEKNEKLFDQTNQHNQKIQVYEKISQSPQNEQSKDSSKDLEEEYLIY
jgi:hypothetical protein